MPLFLDSAEVKRFETGGVKIWQELVINFFSKDLLNFLTLSVLPTKFINSLLADMHFRFPLLLESQQ